MLLYLLGAAGVFGIAKLTSSAKAGGTPIAKLPPKETGFVYYPDQKPAPSGPINEMSLPPWKRNTNFIFGGDPRLATDISAFDPSTPGGRSNLGLFGWTDKLASLLG